MNRRAAVVVAAALAGCPKHRDRDQPHDPPPPIANARDGGSGRGSETLDLGGDVPALPPAPQQPLPPVGLPLTQGINPLLDGTVALGEVLFYDARLSSTGAIACVTCHDPAHDYGGASRQPTAAGEPNLRRAPALANLAWQTAFGWDGRYASLTDELPVHVRGQLGAELATSLARVGNLPMYRALAARARALPIDATAPALDAATAIAALSAFVQTRYDGDAPWDRVERSHDVPVDLKAGYELFTGKAQCSVCHTPPLYTDLGFHRLGLIASHDDGRGRVDPTLAGAFATPTVRGAANRAAFFHDASAATLDAAIDWHLAGGSGQGAATTVIDPALKPIVLSAAERAQLGAFVRALSTPVVAPQPPSLP